MYFVEIMFKMLCIFCFGNQHKYCCDCPTASLPLVQPWTQCIPARHNTSLLLCNNTHIHSPQTANCLSHSPPRPTLILSHLQNEPCWKFHYKLPCVCQIPPGAEEIKTLGLPPPTETGLRQTHKQYIYLCCCKEHQWLSLLFIFLLPLYMTTFL